MSTKVTAKDVAREAGVSVATVSYILNGRTDQKISPETKKKVLQIANLLNYVPSHAAKSLATGRNNAIGISYLVTDSPTRNASISAFVNLLIDRLNRLKYDVTFVPARKTDEGLPINRNIDAIIAIDLSHEDFRNLSNNYLVPVVCVDMLVNDTLFYQIYEDVPFLIEKAIMELGDPGKCYFIYDTCENSYYDDYIIKARPTVFPLKSREMSEAMLEALHDKKVIIYGGFLALLLLPRLKKENICVILSQSEKSLLPPGIPFLIRNDEKKADITMNIVMDALNRTFDPNHDLPVR